MRSVFAGEADPSPVPDPDDMGDWFAAAADPDREALVGVGRYELARRLIRGRSMWR
jgi:hypothetical protein